MTKPYQKKLIDAVQEKLFPLIESRYSREVLLLNQGWCSFQVPMEVQKTFLTDEEINEERLFQMEYAKGQATGEGFQTSYFIQDKKSTTHPYLRKISLLTDPRKDPGAYIKYSRQLEPFFLNMQSLRDEEIGRHNRNLHSSYDPEKKSHLLKVYKEVTGALGNELGFTLNKESKPSDPIFSKPAVGEEWEFVIRLLDVDELTDDYQPPSKYENYRSNEIRPTLPMYFGIRRWPLIKGSLNYLGTQMAHFFPVNELPFHRFYRSFRTFADLETIITFQFAMYRIIQEELEKALIDIALATDKAGLRLISTKP